jgi:general stress protein YciG
MTFSNPNPGNFSNRPEEEVQNIASKGGKSSHSGGFASMDSRRQVCSRLEEGDDQMLT